MISKYAVRDYVNAPIPSSKRWLKKLTRKMLMKLVSKKIDAVGFTFKTEPYIHQLVCFYLGMKHPRFLFLLDMGLGKTKIVLDLFVYLRCAGKAQTMIVVAPNEINVEGWIEEVGIHSDLIPRSLLGTSVDRWDTLEREFLGDVFIIHYAALLHMLCVKKNNKMKPSPKMIARVSEICDVLVIDESHKVKNTQKITHRVVKAISKRCDYVYGLTGTPFGREPIDLFGQFAAIDLGKALGPTLGLFRAAFYREEYTPWIKYIFKQKMKRLLYRKIGTSSIRYRDSECTDVPQVIKKVINIPWTVTNHAWYLRVHEWAKELEKGNAWHPGRGITSGYYRSKNDLGEEQIITFKENPKLEALSELLIDLPADRKAIIFYEYVETGSLIANQLRALDLKHVHVWGKAKDKAGLITKFKQDKDTRILLGNWRIIGTGGNLQVANYGIFFESPSSPVDRAQCEKRYTGARQKNYKVAFVYDLAMVNSYDTRILEFLEQGDDLFQAIIEGRSE